MQSNRNNDTIMSIPKELMDEIDQYGLDSMSILKEVVSEFSHLFKDS